MSEHMYPDKNVMWQSDRVTDTSSWEAVFGRGRIKHQLYVDLLLRHCACALQYVRAAPVVCRISTGVVVRWKKRPCRSVLVCL